MPGACGIYVPTVLKYRVNRPGKTEPFIVTDPWKTEPIAISIVPWRWAWLLLAGELSTRPSCRLW
jgi:hypothetical protein